MGKGEKRGEIPAPRCCFVAVVVVAVVVAAVLPWLV